MKRRLALVALLGAGAPMTMRVVSELVDPDRWVRTMSVSEDGGATWSVLWIDELER